MSKRLTIRQKQWFLIAHIICFVAWMGGVISMLLIGLWGIAKGPHQDLAQTYAIIHLIDDTFVKFPAIGTLITGLILSIRTHWGVTKYVWVIIKEVLTIAIILIGIFFLSDWLGEALDIAEKLGSSALGDPGFILRRNQLIIMTIVNILIMGFMIAISVIQPWGKRQTKKP